MGRIIETDATATKEYEDGKKAFDAIAAGTYDFTVKKVDEITYGGDKSKYSKHPALNVQLRIVDESTIGKGRVFFLRVPLFQKFLPNGIAGAKYPDGAPAFLHFQFYEALGFDVKNGKLPDDRELLGKRIAGKIVLKPADDYNDAPYNEVSSVFESKSKAPVTGERALDGDPWAEAAPAAAAEADPWATDEAPVTVADWKPSAEDVEFASAVASVKKF